LSHLACARRAKGRDALRQTQLARVLIIKQKPITILHPISHVSEETTGKPQGFASATQTIFESIVIIDTCRSHQCDINEMPQPEHKIAPEQSRPRSDEVVERDILLAYVAALTTRKRRGYATFWRDFYEAKASSGISMTDISSFLMALIAASTSGSTFLMKYFALESLPV